MKLRNHTKVSRVLSIALVIGLFFGALLSSNIERTFADDGSTGEKSENHYVTIHDDDTLFTVKTDAATVENVLERAKIEISKGDIVEPGLDVRIDQKDFEIIIHRARPVVIIDGMSKKYLMTATKNIKDILPENGIMIYDGDKIVKQNNTNTLLEVGLAEEYEIIRAGGQTEIVEESIPFSSKTVHNANIAAGVKKITQKGELGKRVTTYEVKYRNGVEVSRVKISEKITKQPVEQITTVGVQYTVTPAPDRETCAVWLRMAGVSENDIETALWIIERESHCRYNATNASSGAYGIPQALPGDKMASAGADWRTNPITQIKWMISYVNGRYGGWSGAKRFWEEHHWY